MKNKRVSKLVILVFAMIMLLFNFSFAYANEILDEGTELEVVVEKGDSMFNNKDYADNGGLPKVTIDDASTWVERKGFEVVGFLQKFIQPFAIIIFIGSGIISLVGAFGNSRLVSRGLIGMGIALVMYVVVLYAPEIMDAFLGWVSS